MSRPRFTYANVVATLCLIAVFGEPTANAARSLVDGRLLRNQSVTNPKLAANSVTSRNVRNGTIETFDLSRRARTALRGAAGPQGERGAAGERGAQGLRGEPGAPGAAGTPGAAGVFAGTFASPDGRFSISVTNRGITLRGPTMSLLLDDTTAKLGSVGHHVEFTPVKATLFGDTQTVVQSMGQTRVQGPSVLLNGSGAPAARVGDSVLTSVNPNGTIVTGSSTVFIG